MAVDDDVDATITTIDKKRANLKKLLKALLKRLRMMAECRALLTSLQTHPLFLNCMCFASSSLQSDKECLDFQNRIFLHSCLGTSPNVSWISKPEKKDAISNVITDDDDDDDDDDENDVINNSNNNNDKNLLNNNKNNTNNNNKNNKNGDDNDNNGDDTDNDIDEKSCLWRRRWCSRESRCLESLATFRAECRENKNTKRCLPNNWSACHLSLISLRKHSRDLLSCQCGHFKNQQLNKKCHKFQQNLLSNACWDSAPYFVYTSKLPELTFSEQKTLALSSETSNGCSSLPQSDRRMSPISCCLYVYRRCNLDQQCSSYLESMMHACYWESNGDHCNRKSCLTQIRNFFMKVKPDLALSLDSRNEVIQSKCLKLKEVIIPTCSRVELPPPLCTHLVDRCIDDDVCRQSWYDFNHHCPVETPKYYKTSSFARCQENQKCTASIVYLMGTLLSTNCTCFAKSNKLKASNLSNVLSNITVGSSSSGSSSGSSSSGDGGDSSSSSSSSTAAEYKRCQSYRKLLHYKNYCLGLVDRPIVGKIIDDDDDDVTDKNNNEDDDNADCNNYEISKVYAQQNDGSRFSLSDRGQCGCHRGQVICVKPPYRVDLPEGLFLHIGYSSVELSHLSKYIGVGIDSITDLFNRILLYINGPLSQSSVSNVIVIILASAARSTYASFSHGTVAASFTTCRLRTSSSTPRSNPCTTTPTTTSDTNSIVY
ncbi:hypothetical protein HELRODRAFT_175648 [Helobdella robusta]|uniref:GDNF/GAS1 domain-containing protein n=1 Tax=Helobdella robusta TaxID=6412 RepID=T1F9H0_HELRO|nr:hypothetical protein HELRODRAFT_175648 [Helobdella robusta]ESO00667.1 hypothetical protein HELRODRAFT_175648 [Helobdella robusta]